QVAAGAVAGDDETGELPSQFRRAGGDPARRRLAVVGRGGEGVLGGEAVIDRDHRQIELMGDFGAERMIDLEIADREPAAVDEHDARAGIARFLRVVETQWNLTGRTRAGEISDHGE